MRTVNSPEASRIQPPLEIVERNTHQIGFAACVNFDVIVSRRYPQNVFDLHKNRPPARVADEQPPNRIRSHTFERRFGSLAETRNINPIFIRIQNNFNAVY